MSRVKARWAEVKEISAGEHALRFIFGGAVTAATGWVSHRFGPGVGGLFLAFPSILPASLTLVKRHEGRPSAGAEARGAVTGSAGLAVFGLVVWLSPETWSPALVLALATIGWLGTSTAVWRAVLAWSDPANAR